MIIIRGVKTLPRLVGAALSERMRVMPAVVVTGARQTGKSTLVEHLVPGKRRYATLDDLDVLDAARRDPEVLVGVPGPVTLDEVQREPELLRAVKRAIDRDRTPGRFLLTGSANLLLMRQVSESLAGRASYLTLWPMTRREQRGLGQSGRWDDLFATPDTGWRELLGDQEHTAEDWRVLAGRGGFPTPALELTTASDRRIWFDGYVRTYLERDLQDLASISGFSAAYAGGLSAHGSAHQPDRTRSRCGATAAHRAPLAQSLGDILPARALASLRSESNQASDQGAENILGRCGPCDASSGSRRA